MRAAAGRAAAGSTAAAGRELAAANGGAGSPAQPVSGMSAPAPAVTTTTSELSSTTKAWWAYQHLVCAEDPLPNGVILAWVDRWVMELKEAPIPNKPSFVSFENPKGTSHGYRELSSWVPEGVNPVVYQLSSDGTLLENVAATGVVKFHEPGEANATFSSAPLDAGHVLLGHASLDVRARLSAADANFYVQLFDVDSADKETFVNDGFLKASHRTSHITPEPVPVGELINYHIAIRPQHYRFASGHRVRVRIWSGPSQDLAQPQPVDVTLETGPSARLRLPGFAADL
jgi:hypothetical protein